MSYFIFDMDETLAELYSVYYFVASLRATNIDDIQNSIQKAYNIFIDTIVNEETSDKRLGVLRPGILMVMKQLDRLRKRGIIKHVVIYSNNGHLESLEFIRDLIHKYLGSDKLIKDCIHWYHPMRKDERESESVANKTWSVLKSIMVAGDCGAPANLEADRVFFFDDLDHIDLRQNLGTNYYRVPAYDFKASFDRIAEIFKDSLIEADVDLSKFSDYLMTEFLSERKFGANNGLSKINEVIRVFRDRTRGTVKEDIIPVSFESDKGIQIMIEAIRRVIDGSNGTTSNREVSGGRRYCKRYRCKLRLTQTKKRLKVRRLSTKKN